MTKKNFKALAEYIVYAESYCEPFTDRQIEHLGNFCHAQNPMFKAKKWKEYIEAKKALMEG